MTDRSACSQVVLRISGTTVLLLLLAISSATAQLAHDYGTGTDGDLVVTGSTFTPNTATELIGDHASGITILDVTDTTGFASGDEVMVIQLQGQGAGLFEFSVIATIGPTTITLASSLTRDYFSAAGNNHAAVVRVPNYTTVEIGTGGELAANSWNGQTGGILVLRASISVTVEADGEIDLSGRGCRGGNAVSSTNPGFGQQGESFGGTGTTTWLRNDGGGGGSYENAGCCTEGAGGGGCGTAGSPGVDGNANGPGQGGAAYTQGPGYLLFGSGGGAGECSSSPVAGGRGAGIVLLFAPSIEFLGNVMANGYNGGSSCWGGSGGGAGGTIWLVSDTVDMGSGLTLALGGSGGPGGGGGNNTAGGAGGVGRIFVAASSVTGSSNPAATVLTLNDVPPMIVDISPTPGATETLVSEISVILSKHVDESSLESSMLLSGVVTGDWIATAFSYDSGTFTATWIFEHTFPDDDYTLTIQDSIVDDFGLALDGEYLGGFPTGDGTPGGDCVTTFAITGNPDDDSDLWPDVDDNCPNDYNPDQGDIDGDGIGNVCDDEVIIDTTITFTEPTSFAILIVTSTGVLIANAPLTVDEDMIVQSGGTVIANAHITVGDDLIFEPNTNIYHHSYPTNGGQGLSISAGDSLVLATDAVNPARINVSGRGLRGAGGNGSAFGSRAEAYDPGSFMVIAGSEGSSGGCYGGIAEGVCNALYDLVEYPDHFGSGGSGCNYGGNGGGLVVLEAGVLVLDGVISADGTNGGGCVYGGGGGGGSGGGVRIRCDVLTGTGGIYARGGNAGNSNPTSAGGGRVAIFSNDITGFNPVTQISARGGDGNHDGSAGTIFIRESRDNDTLPGSLIINNSTSANSSLNTPLLTNEAVFDRLTVRERGRLILTSDFEAMGQVLLQSSAWLTLQATALTVHEAVNNDLRIESGARLMFLAGSTLVFDDLLVTGDSSRIDSYDDVDFTGDNFLVQASALYVNYGILRLTALDGSTLNGGYMYNRGELILADENITVVEGTYLIEDDLLTSDDEIESMTIEPGGVLTHSNYPTNDGTGLAFTARSFVRVEATETLNGHIDVNGKGLRGGGSNGSAFGNPGEVYDPDGLVVVSGPGGSTGASYGGIGAGTSNAPYGLVEAPNLVGSGGSAGCSYGGNGGGFIGIEADQIIVDGVISADGTNGGACVYGGGGGGGSGGGISLRCDELQGAGIIYARGGNAGNSNPTSAGGGRVALYADTIVGFDAETQIDARGGNGYGPGSAGTVFVRQSRTEGSIPGWLIIGNGDITNSPLNTPLLSDESVYEKLTVRALGRLILTSDFVSNTQVSLYSSGWLTLDGALLTVDEVGAPDLRVDTGSRVRLLAGAALDIDNLLVVGGASRLESDVEIYFTGLDFLIQGAAEFVNNSTANLSVLNATTLNGGYIYNRGLLVLADENVTITTGSYLYEDALLTADDEVQSLTIEPGGVLAHSSYPTNPGPGLVFAVRDTLRIESGEPSDGRIDVAGRGLRGAGSHNSAFGVRGEAYDLSGVTVIAGSDNSTGGSYGGAAVGASNAPYGFSEFPNNFGSGGGAGCSYGGNGGGLVVLDARVLVLNGIINADGTIGGACVYGGGGGGGSGGGVRIRCDVLTGTGGIYARGHRAGNSNPTSAGGGRVAIYYDDISGFNALTQVFVPGGDRSPNGAGGTLYLQSNTEPVGQIIIDNEGISSTATTPLLAGPTTFFDVDVYPVSRLELPSSYTHSVGAINLMGGTVLSGTTIGLALDGSLAGTGTVNAPVTVDVGGLVSPGLSPGLLTINGDLNCTPDGTVEFEIGGFTPVTEHDVLRVNGTANLDGTLALSLSDGFMPVHGDTFKVLEYTSSTGRFPSRDFPDLPGTLEWRPIYRPSFMTMFAMDPVIIDPIGGGTYTTIQAALDSVPPYTVIYLTNGTFTGSGNVDIDPGGLPVLIQSVSGDPDSTIIDCGGSAADPHRAFHLHSGEGPNFVIRGITIRNGFVDDSKSPGGSSGGGILVEDNSSPTLQDIVFEENGASSGGGGLHVAIYSDPHLIDLIFGENSSTSGGGGLHVSENSSPVIEGCLFEGNASSSGGGGLHVSIASDPVFINCTIVMNEAPEGAGIFVSEDSDITVQQSIIAFNITGQAVYCENGGAATLSCSDVYGNDGGDWTGCIAGQEGVDGNFSADPQFCAISDGDYHILTTSPCAPENSGGCDLIGALAVGCEPEIVLVKPDGSGDFPNIQAAVTAAGEGDVISLADGIYTGIGNRDIGLPALNITIRSLSGDASAVIIDCEGSVAEPHRAFVISGARGIRPVLENLTIRGGDYAEGGAVYCMPNTRLTLDGCVLMHNSADFGGAIHLAQGSVLAMGCTFYGNSGRVSGGSVFCGDAAQLNLQQTIIAFGAEGEAVASETSIRQFPICCDVYGNVGGDWSGGLEGFRGVLGNISEVPLFLDPQAGDLHVQLDSPCAAEVNEDCGLIGALPGSHDCGGDTTPPVAITALATAQTLTNNPAGETTRIAVSWPAVEDYATVSVYRKGFGNYPEYDDDPGAGQVPEVPVNPTDADTTGWIFVADVIGSETVTDLPPERDFWYYVAFVADFCGNVSTVSNLTPGALNYHLGDVYDEVTGTPGIGDNEVLISDVTMLGTGYGVGEGHPSYNNVLDVGPTVGFDIRNRPVTDNEIQFEDMILFAINFSHVSKGEQPPQPLAENQLRLDVPVLPDEGETFSVLLYMEGDGQVQGLSVPVTWDETVLEPLGVVPGDLLAAQGGQHAVLSPRSGVVDAALMGTRDQGICGGGVIAQLEFRVKRSGEPDFGIGEVLARSQENAALALECKVMPVLPRITLLHQNAPNPFNPKTKIAYDIARSGQVSLRIYDVAGRLVRTLVTGEHTAGRHTVTWYGKDDAGRQTASGMYLMRLEAPDKVQTRKMLLLK